MTKERGVHGGLIVRSLCTAMVGLMPLLAPSQAARFESEPRLVGYQPLSDAQSGAT